MRKWEDHELSGYLSSERSDCYYFWFKGKIVRKMDSLTEVIYEQQLPVGEWNGIRMRNAFHNMFDVLTTKMLINDTMCGRWNGQGKAEYEKNYKRISDIVAKSEGDADRQVRLARNQANKITDEWKAINRAMAAKDMGHDNLFEVFFQRAYELGSVSKQEYREYQMEKLGL